MLADASLAVLGFFKSVAVLYCREKQRVGVSSWLLHWQRGSTWFYSTENATEECLRLLGSLKTLKRLARIALRCSRWGKYHVSFASAITSPRASKCKPFITCVAVMYPARHWWNGNAWYARLTCYSSDLSGDCRRASTRDAYWEVPCKGLYCYRLWPYLHSLVDGLTSTAIKTATRLALNNSKRYYGFCYQCTILQNVTNTRINRCVRTIFSGMMMQWRMWIQISHILFIQCQ